MRASNFALIHRSRLQPLAACLALAFSSETFADAHVDAKLESQPYLLSAYGSHPQQRSPDHPNAPQTWIVQNCTDHDTDSLRDIIENPTKAQSGDTVDLSQLPTLCAMADSTITLTTGQILISQDNLSLQGPAPGTGSITVSGGSASRVLQHTGPGTLSIENLTIADGYYAAAGTASGGCIDSPNSNVYLRKSTVRDCTVLSSAGGAYGGGVSALQGTVTMTLSTVSGNQALGIISRGGGVYGLQVTAKYTSVSDNVAADSGLGGGIYSGHEFSVSGSTVDNNQASIGSAVFSRLSSTSTIVNSTISANGDFNCGTIFVDHADSLNILNSTVAFNSGDGGYCAAISFNGVAPNSQLNLQSSIIANNTVGNTPADIFIYPGHGDIVGADNLVIAANEIPMAGVITVTEDPKLAPLQLNGGWTATHRLLPGSPALARGNNTALPPAFTNDQRGPGYPRSTGPNATVDIGAFEFDTIFSGPMDFN